MHLCGTCLKEGKATDEARPTGTLRAHCPHCTHLGGAPVKLRGVADAMCGRCALLRRECQACGGTALSAEEQASMEAFETLFDAFVTLVKRWGITRARELLRNAEGLTPMEAEHAPTLLSLDLGAVDSMQPTDPYHYRRKRRIWMKVHGTVTFSDAPPRCGECSQHRGAPSMVRAACGHWTAGPQAVTCLPCAVERRACADCEAPTA